MLVLVGVSGCLGRGQTDLLQARLREQQQRLAESQTELQTVQQQLAQARKESDGLRSQLAKAGTPGLLPEQSDLLVRVSGIRINSMLTAGFDQNDEYGDDSLAVHFTPVDHQGEIVKLPGHIRIRVLDPNLPETSRAVAEWNFDPLESRNHWVRGFLGSGYQFTLPWPNEPPRNSQLVVHVQLQPGDGREFSATHVVKITPPVVAAGGQVVPASAAAPFPESTRKPEAQRPVLDDSTNWVRDEFPTYR